MERTLGTAGIDQHADLDRLERWVLRSDNVATLVALGSIRRLQPLYRRSAEGRAWSHALHQARLA